METKAPGAFRTISEVAEWLGVPTHVLRFWESRFSQIKPVKRAGGRRYYRPSDMALLGGIRKLLHDDGMTIRGVQKLLRQEGVKYVASMSPPLNAAAEPGGAEESNVVRFSSGSRGKSDDRPYIELEHPPQDVSSAPAENSPGEIAEHANPASDSSEPATDFQNGQPASTAGEPPDAPRNDDDNDDDIGTDLPLFLTRKSTPFADAAKPGDDAEEEPAAPAARTPEPEETPAAGQEEPAEVIPAIAIDLSHIPEDPEDDAKEAAPVSAPALHSLRKLRSYGAVEDAGTLGYLRAIHTRLEELATRMDTTPTNRDRH